jgi:hypothetical protein
VPQLLPAVEHWSEPAPETEVQVLLTHSRWEVDVPPTVKVMVTVWGDPAGVTLSTFVEIPEKVMVAV